MSLEERGLYVTLLCIQWSKGHITTDDVARLGSGMAELSRCHVLAKFEQGADGHFRNTRMEYERQKQADFRASRSESGKAGANKRWHSHSTAIVLPMAKHSSSSSSYNISKRGRATLEEVELCCAKTGIAQSDAVWFWNKCEANGWTNGGKPIRSWAHTLASWKAAGYLPSQKQPKANGGTQTGRKLTDQEILREAI